MSVPLPITWPEGRPEARSVTYVQTSTGFVSTRKTAFGDSEASSGTTSRSSRPFGSASSSRSVIGPWGTLKDRMTMSLPAVSAASPAITSIERTMAAACWRSRASPSAFSLVRATSTSSWGIARMTSEKAVAAPTLPMPMTLIFIRIPGVFL